MYQRVLEAANRLEGAVHKTPVITSSLLDKHTGNTIFLKCENFQRTGAFKFRGAYNSIRLLHEDTRRKGIIAYSSGNHAQAVALVGKLLEIPTTVVVPSDTSAVKIEAINTYGANIVFYDRDTEQREKVTQQLIERYGYTFIPPFDHEEVIAGQGTAAKELIEEVGELDYLFVPCSGGGLLSGSAISCKHLVPNSKVIGVQPELANYAVNSFKTGELHRMDNPNTIVDGPRGTSLGNKTFTIIRELVDDMVTVSDREVITTMNYLWTRLKIVCEPAGATGLAPLFHRKVPVEGKRIGVIVSGGNVDVKKIGEILTRFID